MWRDKIATGMAGGLQPKTLEEVAELGNLPRRVGINEGDSCDVQRLKLCVGLLYLPSYYRQRIELGQTLDDDRVACVPIVIAP